MNCLLCPELRVQNAEYANCNGEYEESKVRVSWAPERAVFRHKDRDRFIFWNTGGLGWSIGKQEYLVDGRHWHKSKDNDIYISMLAICYHNVTSVLPTSKLSWS